MTESTADETGGDAGRYAAVNGLSLYYEIHGDGPPPLVLLHGALSAIGTSFGRLLPSLARTRRIVAVEQQAHGHTADRDRPLTIGQMADDTVALLEHLGIANADILGYSMGAGVALEIALRRPALVRRLVVVSLAYTNDGLYPELLAGEANLKPEDLVGKVQQMDREFGGWPAEAVRSIGAPTPIVIGDADIVRPEHAVEMLRLLGGGVPGGIRKRGVARSAPGSDCIGELDGGSDGYRFCREPSTTHPPSAVCTTIST